MTRFTSSSRTTPCPVCSRTKDADCRWNDAVILCHSGADLRPGQTMTITGQKWVFIHDNGGFSGSAAIFKPDRERSKCEWLRTSNSPPELITRQTEHHRWRVCLKQLFDAYDAAWNVPDFYSSSPEQLAQSFAVINDAQAKAAALAPHLRTIWRDCPDLKQLYKLRVEACLKLLRVMDRDAWDFQHNELGIPCPVAVQSIADRLS